MQDKKRHVLPIGSNPMARGSIETRPMAASSDKDLPFEVCGTACTEPTHRSDCHRPDDHIELAVANKARAENKPVPTGAEMAKHVATIRQKLGLT